jgi:hypothetical protein
MYISESRIHKYDDIQRHLYLNYGIFFQLEFYRTSWFRIPVVWVKCKTILITIFPGKWLAKIFAASLFENIIMSKCRRRNKKTPTMKTQESNKRFYTILIEFLHLGYAM